MSRPSGRTSSTIDAIEGEHGSRESSISTLVPIGQVCAIKRRVLPSGKVSFDAERNARGHTDELWAVALACQKERSASGPRIGEIGIQTGVEDLKPKAVTPEALLPSAKQLLALREDLRAEEDRLAAGLRAPGLTVLGRADGS